MTCTRRDFGKLALAAPLAALGPSAAARERARQSRPDSVVNGVLIGIIAPYSFQGAATDVASVIRGMTTLGLSGAELQHTAAEAFMGAPSVGRGATPAQAEEIRRWRMATPASAFAKLREAFDAAGIRVYGYKLAGMQSRLTDAEFEYAFDVARVLGASHVNIELGDSSLTGRLGAVAARKKMMVGYHGHQQSSLTAWDEAIAQSPYNGINLDIGHYTAATSQSPLPLIEKHYDRITSIHVKDRELGTKGGANRPWGQGDTPIVEVLRFIRRQPRPVPVTIELEYRVEGSDTMTELATCRDYLKRALA
jgi:sugar phosphate isomerase/epimerase